VCLPGGALRSDQTDGREVSRVAFRIACEQGAAEDGSMRADEKVGENAGLRAAFAAIEQMGLPRAECCVARDVQKPDSEFRHGLIEINRRSKPRRDLRVNDGVDGELMLGRLSAQLAQRPSAPARVSVPDVKNHIGIKQDHRHSHESVPCTRRLFHPT